MILDQLKKELDEVRSDEPLSNHTTFKIGGPAKYFYNAENSQQLVTAVKLAERLKIPYTVLGWGSNLLVSDNGFDGLVIKSSSDNVEVSGQEIRAESGLNLSRLVGLALQNSLVGLETLIGIPGTVGGAAFGNAGAYGVSFSKLIKEVEIYQAGVIKKLSAKEMNFDYRDSVLKYKPGIVLAVTVKLEPGDKKEIQAKAVKLAIERKQKLPTEPSAGCIFKNIKLDKVQLDVPRVIKELDITEAEWQKLTIHGKLSVAFVLDRLGLKGKIIGGCQISPKHANFFINLGNAKAEHVIMMISDVKMRVRNQLTVQLQEEIRYLGF